MTSRYFLWTSVLIVNILLFSSCLNSSDNSVLERPTDPQIYAISLSSSADTTGLLPEVSFTIDQIKGEIFNKEPLPYLFHVDSVMLRISGSNTYFTFPRVELTLEPDSLYIWNQSDSIAIPRLRKIKTTSPDGINEKEYNFTLNIYQSDPYIIDWNRVQDNYLTPPVESQRTITLNNRFYTYYRSGSEMKAVSAPISVPPAWEEITLSGMPHTIRLTSLITAGNNIYGINEASGSVYRSSNATAWSEIQPPYEVKAIYGNLPFAGPGNVLLAVNHDGRLRFAQANEGLSEITLMNDLPVDMPVTDFSAITVESSTVYARKFIFVSGGTKADNTPNNDIWVLQEDEGIIEYITKRPGEDILEGSSLFFYDDQPYLIATTSAGKNVLYHSRNYGVDWSKAGENQAFPVEPIDFTGRKYASVITDANNIWIFGGISSSNTQITDIWRGRLNKFQD